MAAEDQGASSRSIRFARVTAAGGVDEHDFAIAIESPVALEIDGVGYAGIRLVGVTVSNFAEPQDASPSELPIFAGVAA